MMVVFISQNAQSTFSLMQRIKARFLASKSAAAEQTPAANDRQPQVSNLVSKTVCHVQEYAHLLRPASD